MWPLTRRDGALALLVALAALALYAVTLAPGVVALDDDSLEFQLLAQRGGIAHPTGYPLYSILLWLAARLLPVGEVATRANLLSALTTAAAVGLTYLVVRRSGARRAAACLAAAAFWTLPLVWAQSTVAEVYGLHLLLSALLILTLLVDAPLPVVALVLGLGLTHHRSIVLWGPALLIYVALAKRQWLRPQRSWLVALAALLLPLLIYAWLPLRAPVGSADGTYGQVGFWCWVRACQYEQSFLGRDNELARRVPPSFYATLTRHEVGLAGIALAGVGLLVLARSRPALAALFGLGAVVNALFAMNFIVPDREVYWIPFLWLLTLLIGWGVEGAMRGAERLSPRLLPALLWVAVAAWLLGRGVATFPTADRSAVVQPTLAGEPINGPDMLTQPLPDDAMVIGLLGEISYLRYLQQARAIAPTIATDGGDSEQARWAAIERALQAGRTPFLTRPLAGIESRFALAARGPLLELRAQPITLLLDGLRPLDQPMGQGITLVGWQPSLVAQSDLVRLALAWRAAGPTSEPLSVSVRALDAAGNELAAQDRPPLRGAYPTTVWHPNEVVLDAHEVAPAPPGGGYRVILYRAADGSEVGRAVLTVP